MPDIMNDDDERYTHIAIPERFRIQFQQRLAGCEEIKIEYEVSDGKWQKVQGKILTGAKSGRPAMNSGMRNEDDLVADALETIHEHYIGYAEDGLSVKYRVWFHGYKNGARSRTSFQYIYSGPDDDGTIAEESDTVNAHVMIVRSLQGIIGQLATRLDEAHIHIRELSASNTKMFDPLEKLVAYAGAQYVASMEMTNRALNVIYLSDRDDKAERAKDRRLEKYAQMFGPAVSYMAQAAMGWLMSKMTGQNPMQTAQGMADGEQPSRTDDTQPVTVTEGEREEVTIPNPLATIIASFYTSLTAMQIASLHSRFTKAEFQEFFGLLQSQTDPEVVDRWRAIADGSIPKTKMVSLLPELTAEQQQMFSFVQQGVSRYGTNEEQS